MAHTGNADPVAESDFPDTLSAPALSALIHAGYTTLHQLTKVREAEIAALHGMGPKGIRLLREALADRGLSFADA